MQCSQFVYEDMARETHSRLCTITLLSIYLSALLRCGGTQLFYGYPGNPEEYQVISESPLRQGGSTVKLSCQTMGSPKNPGTAYVCVPTKAAINLNFRPGGTEQHPDKSFFESLLKQLYNLYLNNRCPGKYEASHEYAPEMVKCPHRVPQPEVDSSPVGESCKIPVPECKCEEQAVVVKDTDDYSESADPDDATEIDITDESQPSYEDEVVKETSQSHNLNVTVDISHKSHHSRGQEDKPEGKEAEHSQESLESEKSQYHDSDGTKINISHESHDPLSHEDNLGGKENPVVVEHPPDHSKSEKPENHHSDVTEINISHESHKPLGHEDNPGGKENPVVVEHPPDHSKSEKPENHHSDVTEINISHESHKPLGHEDNPGGKENPVVVEHPPDHSISEKPENHHSDVTEITISHESNKPLGHEDNPGGKENPVVVEHPPDHSQSEKPQNHHSVVTEVDISHESHEQLGHEDNSHGKENPVVVVHPPDHSETKDPNDVVIVQIPQESHLKEEKPHVDENPVLVEHPPDNKPSDDGEKKDASAAEPHKHFYGLKCGDEIYTLEDIRRLCPMISFIKKHWGNRANVPRVP